MRPSVRSLGTKALMLAALAAPARSQEGAPALLDTESRVEAVLTGSERDQVLTRVRALRRQIAETSDALVRARAQAALEALEAAAGLPASRVPAAETAPVSEPAAQEVSPSRKALAWALAIAVLVAAALALAKRGDKKAAARKLARAEKQIKELAEALKETEALAENLANDLKAADEARDGARKALALADGTLAETRAKLAEAEENALLANTQADELGRQAAELRQALENSDAAALMKRIEEISASNEQLAGRLNVAQGEISLHAKDNTALQEKIRVDRAVIVGLERQVQDVQALAESDRAARLEEIGQLIAAREAAFQQVRDAERTAQEELESSRKRSQEELAGARAALGAAQAELAAAREAHRAAQAELASAAAGLAASEIARSDDHRRHGEVLSREVARLEGEIALAQSRLKAAEAAAEDLRQRALANEARLEAELVRAQTRHQEETALRQSEFSAKLAELESRAARDLEAAHARAQELSDRLGAAGAALARKSEESDAHAANHAAAAKEVAALNGILRAHLADLEQAADTIERLRERLKAANFDLIARDANRRVEESVQLLEAARAKQEEGVAKSHEILAQGEAEAATLRQRAEQTRQALDAAVARQAERLADSLKEGVLAEAKAALDKQVTPDFLRNTARDVAVDAISGDPKVRAAAEQAVQSITASRGLEIKRQVTGELEKVKDETIAEGKAALSAVAAGLSEHKREIEGLVAFAKAKIREEVAGLRGKLRLMAEKVSEDHGKLTAILTKDRHVKELGERAENAENQGDLNDIIKELGVVVMEDEDFEELPSAHEGAEAAPETPRSPSKSPLPQITAAVTRAPAEPYRIAAQDAGRALAFIREENALLLARAHSSPNAERLAKEGEMFERALHIAISEAGDEGALLLRDESLTAYVKAVLAKLPRPAEDAPTQDPGAGTKSYPMHTESEEIRKAKAGGAEKPAAGAAPAAPKTETSGWRRPAEPAVAVAPAAAPHEPAIVGPAAAQPAPRVADIHISMDDGSEAAAGESAGISGKHPVISASHDDVYLEFLRGTGTNLADIAVNRIFPSLPAGFSATVTLGTKTLQIHRVDGAGSSHHFSMYSSPLQAVGPEDRVLVSYDTGRVAPQAGNGWVHADSPLAFKMLALAVHNWSRRVAERGAPAPGRHHHVGQVLDALAQTAIQVGALDNPKPAGKDKARLSNLLGARENLAVLWLRHHGKNGAQVADDLENYVVTSFPYNAPLDIVIGNAKTQFRPSKDGCILADAVSPAEARERVGTVSKEDHLRVNAAISDRVVDSGAARTVDRHHVVGALVMRVKAWSERLVLAGICKREMSAVYLTAVVGSEVATKLRAMKDGKHGHDKLPEAIARFDAIVKEYKSRAKKQ